MLFSGRAASPLAPLLQAVQVGARAALRVAFTALADAAEMLLVAAVPAGLEAEARVVHLALALRVSILRLQVPAMAAQGMVDQAALVALAVPPRPGLEGRVPSVMLHMARAAAVVLESGRPSSRRGLVGAMAAALVVWSPPCSRLAPKVLPSRVATG